MAKLLNIGCGLVFHKTWTNIDVVSSSPHVRAYDLNNGLPYSDGIFDGCYSSHVLEHLHRNAAREFLKDCFRVLKPGGVIRVVVPDLEGIVRSYLETLTAAETTGAATSPDYDWALLELLDQMVRGQNGGEMLQYLRNPKIANKEFVLFRVGTEAERVWQLKQTPANKSLKNRLMRHGFSSILPKVRTKIAKGLVSLVGGAAARRAFDEGLFRNSGEIHRWMYDRFSLRQLLERTGFTNVRRCRADESSIVGYSTYKLDTDGDRIRKPDSLFMEGVRP